jgi:hypothetical protein
MAVSIESWNTSELLAACCGGAVKVWGAAAADARREVHLSEGAPVAALDWSGNNKVLAVAGDKAQVTMVGGGKVIGYVPEAPEPGLAGITAMRFSADSKKLAIGCANRALHIRDLRSQVGAAAAAPRGVTGGGAWQWRLQPRRAGAAGRRQDCGVVRLRAGTSRSPRLRRTLCPRRAPATG